MRSQDIPTAACAWYTAHDTHTEAPQKQGKARKEDSGGQRCGGPCTHFQVTVVVVYRTAYLFSQLRRKLCSYPNVLQSRMFRLGVRSRCPLINILYLNVVKRMFASLFRFNDNEEGEEGKAFEDAPSDQQQEGGVQQSEAKDDRFNQVPLGKQSLRAVWGERDVPSLGGAEGKNAKGAVSRSDRHQRTDRKEETQEERTERRRVEGTEDASKRKLDEKPLDTLADAMEYCQGLVEVQLQRAKDQSAQMNVSINGDSHVRRAITTLLPDAFIRELFLTTTRSKEAWPRIRSLFGAPPFNFLRPEDAGLIRATGISSGRTNMAYNAPNDAASYAQFGESHLVDEFLRQYRVVPSGVPREGDQLPCDIERIAVASDIHLNVRVPKRSKEERNALLKDATKRKAVFFPQVGETLTVRYSQKLQLVWRRTLANDTTLRVVVKQVAPRSATSSTAAVLAVKVS